eukprot:ANDGO_03316.mRNA.1 Putative white-brown complex homolog protein 30
MDCGGVDCASPNVFALLQVPCPQGFFCPPNASISTCSRGHYCPSEGLSSPVACSAGTFCPDASYKPYDCDAFGICMAESAKQFTFQGIFVSLLLAILMGSLIQYYSKPRRRKHDRTDREDLGEKKSLLGSKQQISAQRHSNAPGITFSQVSFSVNKKKKRILDSVSGFIAPGKLTGILGPSGAGKTTLLHILTGKLKPTEGLVKKADVLVGYVPQDDIMLNCLTVREVLVHATRTRSLVRDVDAHVDNVLALLGLTDVQDTVIGDEYVRGVSGGQKKRVSIGLELVADTPVLALDEPTSGLDAASAVQVVACLKDIVAQQGTTVFAVVHQPRYEVFQMFDQVILLGKGGHVVYCGSREYVLEAFEKAGYRCPDRVNPPDFLLDTLSTGSVGTIVSDAVTTHGGFSHDSYQAAPLHPVAQQKRESHHDGQKKMSSNPVPVYAQIWPYIQRAFLTLARNKRAVAVAFLMHLTAGAVLGITYVDGNLFEPPIPAEYYLYNVCPEPVRDYFCGMPVKDEVAVLAGFILLGVSLIALAVGVNTLGEERLIFFREVSSGQSALAYYVGKLLADLPLLAVCCLVYVSAFYTIMSPRGHFWNHYACAVCIEYTVFGLSYLISLVVKRDNAALVALVVTSTWGTTSGIAVSVKDLGIFGTLSYPRWAGEAVYVTELRLDQMSSQQEQAVRYYVEHFAYNYDLDEFPKDLLMLIMFGTVFRFLTYIVLKLADRHKQR